MKKTTDLLKNKRLPLSAIAHKITYLQAINQHLQAVLPPELRSHCEVANLNEHCLVLLTDNAHWLTTLRFAAPELLKKLQAAFPVIKTLKYLIVPTDEERNPKHTAQLSPTAAKTIQEFANSVEDATLKQSLTRLSSRCKKT